MRRLLAACAALCVGSAALADQTACPKLMPGQPTPWSIQEHMPGDEWGYVHLFIDKHGRAVGCGLSETNIRSKDRRGILCMSFEKNWYTKPIIENDTPVEKWVKRPFVIFGGRHEKADDLARKRYLQEHPAEAECYN
jgi:hypothetical protein